MEISEKNTYLELSWTRQQQSAAHETDADDAGGGYCCTTMFQNLSTVCINYYYTNVDYIAEHSGSSSWDIQ